MPPIAYVNPRGKKLKRTKTLKRRKAKKNPAALLALSNGKGKPATSLTKRSSTMARKKRRVKRANPKRRKRRNAWPGDSTRHSLAKKTGSAGGPYKSRWGKRKYGNPARRRKHSNPSGPGDLLTMLGVTVVSFIGTKVISSFASKQLEGMLPEGIKPYTKPLISTSVPVLVYFFGDKMIKNPMIKNSIIVGSGLAAVHDLAKAFAPTFAMDYLSDMMGENEVISLSDDDYAKALEYAQANETVDGGDTVTVDGEQAITVDGLSEDYEEEMDDDDYEDE